MDPAMADFVRNTVDGFERGESVCDILHHRLEAGAREA